MMVNSEFQSRRSGFQRWRVGQQATAERPSCIHFNPFAFSLIFPLNERLHFTLLLQLSPTPTQTHTLHPPTPCPHKEVTGFMETVDRPGPIDMAWIGDSQ